MLNKVSRRKVCLIYSRRCFYYTWLKYVTVKGRRILLPVGLS